MCKALRGVFYAIFSVGLYKKRPDFSVGVLGLFCGAFGVGLLLGGRGRLRGGCRFGGIGGEVGADVAVAALGRDVEHALITGGQTLFRVGQRGSGQSQLVGEVRLTAQQHLNAVLVGELNITQILDVQRRRAVKQVVLLQAVPHFGQRLQCAGLQTRCLRCGLLGLAKE